MHVVSMICSHANVGIDSSDAMRRLGPPALPKSAVDAHASLDLRDVEEAEHGRAAVLDLHDLCERSG